MIDRRLFEILSTALGTSYIREDPDKFKIFCSLLLIFCFFRREMGFIFEMKTFK